jgi:uncharacterized membrane protein
MKHNIAKVLNISAISRITMFISKKKKKDNHVTTTALRHQIQFKLKPSKSNAHACRILVASLKQLANKIELASAKMELNSTQNLVLTIFLLTSMQSTQESIQLQRVIHKQSQH